MATRPPSLGDFSQPNTSSLINHPLQTEEEKKLRSIFSASAPSFTPPPSPPRDEGKIEDLPVRKNESERDIHKYPSCLKTSPVQDGVVVQSSAKISIPGSQKNQQFGKKFFHYYSHRQSDSMSDSSSSEEEKKEEPALEGNAEISSPSSDEIPIFGESSPRLFRHKKGNLKDEMFSDDGKDDFFERGIFSFIPDSPKSHYKDSSSRFVSPFRLDGEESSEIKAGGGKKKMHDGAALP